MLMATATKLSFVIVALITIFTVVSYLLIKNYSYIKVNSQLPRPKVELLLNQSPYYFEAAISNSEKAKGLSNRTMLCPHCGMIFIFNREGDYPFWMKDTQIPLDIIWLNEKGKVVTIYTAFPEPNAPIFKLKLYRNTQPAKYVLEIAGGTANNLNLSVGDTIDLSPLSILKYTYPINKGDNNY